MKPRFRDGPWTSLSVGVQHAGQTVQLHFAKGAEAPPADAVYEMGSISKVYTGLLLARRIEEGAVELSTPVQTLLPESVQLPEDLARDLTLRHLTTHRSGFGRMPANMFPAALIKHFAEWDPYRNYPPEDFDAFLRDPSRKAGPGEKYRYSNAAWIGWRWVCWIICGTFNRAREKPA